MISIKGSHSYCLFFKVAQNFGVGYQQKDLKNLLDQVTVAVCHKEGVLFDPQFQKSFVNGYIIMQFLLAQCCCWFLLLVWTVELEG